MYIYKSNNGNAYLCNSEVVNCENIELICDERDAVNYKEKLDNLSKKDRMRVWEFLNVAFKFIQQMGVLETEDYEICFEKTDQADKILLTNILEKN
jgi:hypothetical protein